MNCEKVLTLIEDYHYGELSGDLASQVASHLTSCTNCARELEALIQEEALLRSYSDSLERNLDVRPGMWQAVQARQVPERARRSALPALIAYFEGWLPGSRLARYAIFAAVVACISVGGTLLTLRMLTPVSQERVSDTQYSSSRDGLEAALHSVQRAETEYLEAIRILSAIVDKQKETLDAGQRAELERNLRVLDQAIVKARQAYHAHPSDPELGFYMLAAYREKVELLEELATS